jgi:hypothetical protein
LASAPLHFDPDSGDSRRYGYSLAHLTELIVACLDAAGARSVAEIGAFAGDFTRVLAQWAADRKAKVIAIDPAPQPALVALADDSSRIELILRPSLEALDQLDELPDAVIIDGDHNYYTVTAELRAIAERAEGLPLLLLHDVSWPHARRDDYFDPAAIPDSDRHPVIGSHDAGLFPGEVGTVPGGLPYPNSAACEGGPRNGVLTAVEDFASARGLRLAVVPAFFGLGAVWDREAPWSQEIERVLAPYDRNPILERLEAARVHHLAEGHRLQREVWQAQEKLAKRDHLLRRMLESSAFAVADRLSRLRARAGVAPAQSAVTKDEIRRVLSE